MKFDTLTIGQTFESATYTITKEEIITFAEQFDPQYMHLNEQKAEQSIFEGIIASGLHTLSLSQKLWVELNVYGDDVIAGTGVSGIEFNKPVYPGDVLKITAEIIEKSERKRNGEVTLLLTTYKNDTEQVMRAKLSALVEK